jgi:hypothetical protein
MELKKWKKMVHDKKVLLGASGDAEALGIKTEDICGAA